MSATEAVAAVAWLMKGFRVEMTEGEVGVYVEQLRDIEPGLLHATCERLIQTKVHFPRISEIRLTALELAGLLPPSPAEALAMIRRADVGEWRGGRDGTRGYFEKLWDWSEIPEAVKPLIEDVLARVGDPSDLDGKPHFSWEMGFQKTYEKAAEAVKQDALANLSRARLPEGDQKLLEGK